MRVPRLARYILLIAAVLAGAALVIALLATRTNHESRRDVPNVPPGIRVSVPDGWQRVEVYEILDSMRNVPQETTTTS